MSEDIENHNKENDKYTKSQLEHNHFRKINPTRINAWENDRAYLVPEGTATTRDCMAWVLQLVKLNLMVLNKAKCSLGLSPVSTIVFKKKILCTFIRLLKEYYELGEAASDEAFHRKLRFSSSALISDHKVPSL